jgi:uncharacterized membrane protein
MRKYFITGLLILVPLAITAWVLNAVISTMDQSLLIVPERWQPRTLIGFDIPGLGTILTIVVSSLYGSVKQVSDTLFSSSGNAFRKAVLLPYPAPGCWTIGFLTGVPGGDVKNHLIGDFVSVYVPTTPNPTSGFFLMMERAKVIELDMSVDAALKYIVSMGVVAPESLPTK